MYITRILLQIPNKIFNVYDKCAITACCQQCANEGLKILIEGGSAVDAAITSLLCAGVKYPQRSGIGGGFIATIYSKRDHNVRVLTAREKSPLHANKHMFNNSRKDSLFGGKAVGVPGILKGYWELHQKYGRLPWKRLFEPVLKICYEGCYVPPFTYFGMQQVDKEVYRTKTLRELLIDPFSGKSKIKKYKIYHPILGRTLELIALNSPEVLYNGILTKHFVKDIQNAGGIITEKDMNFYQPKWHEPLKISLSEKQINIYTPPPPSSGAVLLFALLFLNKDGNIKNLNSKEQWYRIIETLKYGYGFRTKLGDPEHHPFVSKVIENMLSEETIQKIRDKFKNTTSYNYKYYGGHYMNATDAGTYHFNVISSEGDAISITESINTLFGALFKSQSTGIILNNTMNDFASLESKCMFTPLPTAANLILPGKFPLSSTLPTIITKSDNSEVTMSIGGAGGMRIVSGVCQILIRHLLIEKSLQEAINHPRIHHQLIPMQVQYENNFPTDILEELSTRGHKITRLKRNSVVTAIKKTNHDKLEAIGDSRRHCSNAGI